MLARVCGGWPGWQQCRTALHCSRPSTCLLKGTATAVTAEAYSSAASPKKPPISQRVRFIDWLRIVARGGQGGGGSSALFGRTGHHPRAAGGNGAPGGCVVLRATRQLTGLGSIPLHVEAERGGHGGKQWMDGKRGADRVVQVPLGTMVWRMVQLRGAGADAPHGVTAMTQPAAQHAAQHQGQLQQPWGQQAAADTALSEEQEAVSSSSGQHHRRRLFGDSQLQHADAPDAAAVASTDEAQQEGAAADMGHSAGQGGAGSLYDDLLHCRVVLSNQQKLQLLHSGCLEGSAGSMFDAGWGDSSEQDEWGSSSASDSEVEEPELEEGGDWGGKQQGRGAEHYTLPGEDSSEGERHFDKQQVWSILSAQAELLGVLEAEGQELVVARGGRGGRGNALAPSNPHRPASKQRSDGQPGQEVMLLLQLRLMADVALVGLPNVGKSSLIGALTGARAQVGSYAFTTLRPQLGALLPSVPDDPTDPDLPQPQPTGDQGPAPTAANEPNRVLAAAAAAGAQRDSGLTGHQLVLADLPGLVPGAHEGRGRGTDFLKHLQKVRCIVLVVDMTGRDTAAGDGSSNSSDTSTSTSSSDSRELESEEGQGAEAGWQALVPHSPEQQVQILMDELRCYDARMLSLPMLVVANKVDAMSAQAAAGALQRLKAATDLPILPVSAQKQLGLQRLRQSLELLAGGVHSAAATS